MGWGFGKLGGGRQDIRKEENWNIRRREAGLISASHADWQGGLWLGGVGTLTDEFWKQCSV